MNRISDAWYDMVDAVADHKVVAAVIAGVLAAALVAWAVLLSGSSTQTPASAPHVTAPPAVRHAETDKTDLQVKAIVAAALTEARDMPAPRINAAITQQLSHAPSSSRATLVKGLGEVPSHPTFIELSVQGQTLCYLVPVGGVPEPISVACP